MNFGFPDVCNTPVGPATVPIPYPNIGMNAQASPFALIVKVTKLAALNLASKITMTSGDEAGVAHPTIKGMGAYTMGNPIVFIEKVPGIMLTAPTTGNMMNNALGMVAVPSAVNVLYTQRPARRDDERLSGAPIVGAQRCGGDIAQLQIRHFSRDLPAAFYTAISKLERDGALAALIIDLRGCPGGELSAAIELCGEFLPRGAHIATITDHNSEETCYRARHAYSYPHRLVVLVDGGTASAAELFAGSLQRHGRAIIVGEPTYGKRTAHCLVPDHGQPGKVGRTSEVGQPSEMRTRRTTIAQYTLPGCALDDRARAGCVENAVGIQPDHRPGPHPDAYHQLAMQLATSSAPPSVPSTER